MDRASHPGRNRTARRAVAALALSLPALSLAFAPAARAAPPVTIFKLTISSQLKAHPYTIHIQAEKGGLRGLSVFLIRGSKVQEIHQYDFPFTGVDFGLAGNLSGGHLDTGKAMGRFGRVDVQVHAVGSASTAPLTCGDGTVFGSHTSRRGIVTGPATLKADTTGSHYFGVVSNRGHAPQLPKHLDGAMSKFTITRDCPGSPSSPCQPGLTLATTAAPILNVALVKDDSGDALTIAYVEDGANTGVATVSHSVQISVGPGKHPFSAEFKADESTAHLKASGGKPFSEGSGSFTGPAATMATEGSCTTKTSDGQFQGNGLALHFDSVASGKKNVSLTTSVVASLVQTQVMG